jgi:DNA gyrase/topoisomerase IV subunit A
VTQGSYVKRTPLAAYRAQRRGGRGVQGMRTKAEDEVVDLVSAHTLDHLLFFTNRGRVYGQRVFALPETARDGKGLPLVNFLNLAADERVTTLLAVPDFEQAEYVTLLTRQAKIKRVKLSEFDDVRPSGIIAMNLGPGDELGWARATAGNQEFIIVTAGGRALRFAETEVRAMGRSAAGVGAINLNEGDGVACFDVIEPEGPQPQDGRAVDAVAHPVGRDRQDRRRPRRAGGRSGNPDHVQRHRPAHPRECHQPDEPYDARRPHREPGQRRYDRRHGAVGCIGGGEWG